jgi:hypothetical protein
MKTDQVEWVIGFKSGEEITLWTSFNLIDLMIGCLNKNGKTIILSDDRNKKTAYLCVADISYINQKR